MDKYIKVNKIRNKQIIDIRKIIDEEKINLDSSESLAFFKLLIWSRIKTAREKNKDIYYIPNFTKSNLNVDNLLNLKSLVLSEEDNFNLLCFFDEFTGTSWLEDILDNLDDFDNSQILRDY